jgi:hypothetical protein
MGEVGIIAPIWKGLGGSKWDMLQLRVTDVTDVTVVYLRIKFEQGVAHIIRIL